MLQHLWDDFIKKMGALKEKIDPSLHKDVDEIAGHVTKMTTATEDAVKAVAKEEPVIAEAAKVVETEVKAV